MHLQNPSMQRLNRLGQHREVQGTLNSSCSDYQKYMPKKIEGQAEKLGGIK